MKAEIKDNFFGWCWFGGFSVSNFGQKMRTAWCRLSFHWHARRLSFRNFRFKMPRSERVILHVSINMGRLPGEVKGGWANVGKELLNNFETVSFHWRQHPQVSSFPIIPSPGLVQEVRYSRDFPQERNYLSEIQQVFFRGHFWGVLISWKLSFQNVSGKSEILKIWKFLAIVFVT